MYKRHPTLKYYISDRGIIMKTRGCGQKKTTISIAGYEQITCNGKCYFVHRLVYETFHGSIPRGFQINHINGVKTDNRLDNLELVTPSENLIHAHRTGLKPDPDADKNGMSKLSNEQYYSLVSDIVAGMSNEDIGSKYNLHPRYVSLIRGKKRLQSIWKQYETDHGINTIPLSGGASSLPLSERLSLLTDLGALSNKSVADKYQLDPSTVSHIRAKRIWKQVWAIYEQKVRRPAIV